MLITFRQNPRNRQRLIPIQRIPRQHGGQIQACENAQLVAKDQKLRLSGLKQDESGCLMCDT